jgi:mono/diheme cytochrome c family protein
MRTLAALVPLLLTVGCASGEAPAPEARAPLAATFQAQAARGQALFAEHCAGCHGASGQGSRLAPRLVGLSQGALPLEPRAGARLRRTEFRTVADVASFVTTNMPANAPASLPTEDYWDILAFNVKANGLALDGQRLDAATAATLRIPR